MKKGAVVSLRAGARNIFDSSKPLLARFRRGDSASHVRVELITVNTRLSVVQSSGAPIFPRWYPAIFAILMIKPADAPLSVAA